MKLLAGGILLALAFAVFPLITQRNDLLNLGIQIFLAVALAQSWNLLGGYAGQITLGHAAFFGLGALVTRVLWVNGAPLLLALVAGALVATAFGVLIGLPACAIQILLALYDPDTGQASDHQVVEVRLTIGISGNADEFDHRNGAVVDHLQLVCWVHGKVGSEVRGSRRR